jgi:adenosylcobyric acid synthase
VNGLLVAGTASEAGKSAVTAGSCRWLARRGVKVAPFKAQNMSLNSVVTRDGAEIGRAQAMQAAAAGIEPEAALNPVLLKPGAGGTSQVMVLGRPVAEADALSYSALKPRLAETVQACLAGLADRFAAVICEGAGSPAEINLREHDITNMGLARAAGLPVIVVADIDRGGALAALYGTLALLSREDQALVSGFVVNKFRGDARLLEPGLDRLRELTGRPVLGVLPWTAGLWPDAEDSLTLGAGPDDSPATGPGGEVLRVVVIRLPRISNFTDIDPLIAEPGVAVRFVTSPAEVTAADLVILPGSRATVADLAWLRERGLADAVAGRAARGGPVLGICGGFQRLAREIRDEVESGAGAVPGLGLLPATTEFGPAKVLRLRQETCVGEPVTGYEIHHGVVTADGGGRGIRRGGAGHHVARHLRERPFRRALLDLAAAAGAPSSPAASRFAQIRERKLDTLVTWSPPIWIRPHCWTIDRASAGLPFIPRVQMVTRLFRRVPDGGAAAPGPPGATLAAPAADLRGQATRASRSQRCAGRRASGTTSREGGNDTDFRVGHRPAGRPGQRGAVAPGQPRADRAGRGAGADGRVVLRDRAPAGREEKLARGPGRRPRAGPAHGGAQR